MLIGVVQAALIGRDLSADQVGLDRERVRSVHPRTCKSPSLSKIATLQPIEPEQLPEPLQMGARICKAGPRFLQG